MKKFLKKIKNLICYLIELKTVIKSICQELWQIFIFWIKKYGRWVWVISAWLLFFVFLVICVGPVDSPVPDAVIGLLLPIILGNILWSVWNLMSDSF